MTLRLDRASDRPRRAHPSPSGIRLRALGRVGGIAVRLVDGERVRNEIDTDFALGGSSARYAYVPTGEVWVEASLSTLDRNATALHELVERRLMLQGLTYSKAHDQATKVEEVFRASVGDGSRRRFDATAIQRALRKRP